MPKGFRFRVSTQMIGDVPGYRKHGLYYDVAIADETEAREALLKRMEGSQIEQVAPMPESIDIKEGEIKPKP